MLCTFPGCGRMTGGKEEKILSGMIRKLLEDYTRNIILSIVVNSVDILQYLFPRFKVDSLARVWTRCDSVINCI